MQNPRKKKILVVDDESEVVTFLSNLLMRADYEVLSTTKGKEAVTLALGHTPDLVVLDMIMPDMKGGEVVSHLAEAEATKDIPVIFLTGMIDKEEEERVKKSGKFTLLAKPISGEEFLEAVENVLKESRGCF